MSDSQVPFATLGNAIGFISKLSGSVTIQSIDGQERVVKIGDPIFFGETVVTGANSSVTIAFIDGTEVVIGGDSVVEITDEIYNSGDNQDLVADSSTDIDALQNAILAGDDPTLVQDAPAAGETQGEQQRVDVDVQRTGALGGISGGNDTDYSSSLPGFGYDTNGQGSASSRQENVNTTQQNTTRNSSSDTTTSDTSVSTPTISLATSSDTGESNSDLLTNDTTATFTLSNIDSDVVLVQIYNGDTLINSTTAVDGLQTFTAEVGDLTEGTNSLTIKVTDSSGNTSTSSPVVVTLDTVANEGTVTVNAITSDDVINANEAAGTVTVTGTATGGDIAEGDAVTMTINGNVYNTTVDASGNWSVDVAGSDLAADTEFDVVVTSSDDAGNAVESTGSSTHTINQAPVFADSSENIVEDDNISGTLTATDIDLPAGAQLTFSTASSFTGFTLDSNGNYEFDSSSYDSLSLGEKEIVVIPITVTDDQGDSTTANLTITITGTNDSPVVQSSFITMNEDSLVTGQIVASDVDLPVGESLTFSTTSTVEGLVFNSDGSYSFDASSYDSLASGDSKFITIPITVEDELGATGSASLRIRILGVNDGPVAVDDTATGTEDGGMITIDVLANDTDVDGDTLTITAATVPAEQGKVAIVDGKLEFTPAENFNGEATISYTISDGEESSSAEVAVTVDAVNDAAIIGGDTFGVGSETDEALSWTGTLTATDADNSNNTFTPSTTVGTSGSLSITAAGVWTFVANSAFDELSAGEIKEEVFTVTSEDGTSQDITITITGTNDAPVAEAATGAVAEDATITGTISASDVDLADDASLVFSTTSTVEGLTLNANGTYRFDASSYDSLKEGETLVLEIPVTVTDDQNATDTTTLIITVTGTNDAPTIDTATGSTQVENVAKAGDTVATFTASDLDGDTITYSITSGNDNGYFAIDSATGVVTLTAAGETALSNDALTDTDYTLGVTANDGTVDSAEATAIIKFDGVNDAPTIDSTTVATGEVTEDAATTTVSGDIDASDIDTLDASLSYSLDTTAGTYGSISINEETGEWTYTINNDAAATQALNNGQTETETFTVTVTNNDGETITQEITVSVKGADDVATIDSTTVATGEVTEDAATTTVSGDIDASDIDTLDASLSCSLDTTAGTYGSISINEETGEWTYTINNDAAATQALNNGQTETETFTVTVTNNDGETITQEITVSVKGADDVATIDSTTVATGEVTEDAATTTVSGDIDASDIDTLDASLSYSLDTTAGTYGSISINEETGEWTYTINNDAAATQALNNGQTETETFTVTVTNNDGETITQEITVSVKGADDVATIDSTTVATGEVTEDAATTTVSGDIDASDIDTLDASLSYSLDTTAGTYGSISINEETGEWTYTINNDAAATQALNNGQTETETFTVTVTNNDGETITQEITVSVKGADDVATIDSTTVATGEVTEDAATTTVSGDIDASDIDTLDASLSYSLDTTAGTYGSISINEETGEWTYTINNDAAATQALNNGQTETETFTVTVTNNDGETIRKRLPCP
ncbi:retention module-containing protein [Marinomonas pontica]|uniref:retention module-containing protein n=1 Tax=Marinomonas pontica TaxID=264739 RepID=UPI002243AA68|nr:retention module-containing protein [Marinomonas pontica]MCW8356555.1 retention module-containing protein [Marinomonas pontica]